MTTHMNRKPLVATGVAVLVAALLAGCGGGDVDAFCKDANDTSGPPLAESDDPEKFFGETIEKFEAIDPPSEIKGDWEILSSAAVEMYEGMRDLDPESETNLEDSVAVMEGLDDAKVQEASANIDAFVEKNCEGGDTE